MPKAKKKKHAPMRAPRSPTQQPPTEPWAPPRPQTTATHLLDILLLADTPRRPPTTSCIDAEQFHSRIHCPPFRFTIDNSAQLLQCHFSTPNISSRTRRRTRRPAPDRTLPPISPTLPTTTSLPNEPPVVSYGTATLARAELAPRAGGSNHFNLITAQPPMAMARRWYTLLPKKSIILVSIGILPIKYFIHEKN